LRDYLKHFFIKHIVDFLYFFVYIIKIKLKINTMKKITKIKISMIPLLFILGLVWKWFYFHILYPEMVEYEMAATEEVLKNLIPNVIREELVFRLIPYLIGIGIAFFIINSELKKGIILLTLFLAQIIFGISHIPFNEAFRVVMMNRPASPEIGEYLQSSLWGVMGCFYAAIFVIFAHQEGKPKRLWMGLIHGLIGSSVLHVLYNLTCLKFHYL